MENDNSEETSKENSTNCERGSEWRKWDLHFHTPSSYDYKDFSVTNENIIDGLVEKNISAVIITDHHEIDVSRIQELSRLGKEKGVTVLPGIEFLSDAKGSDSIHFIGVFSEDLSSIEHIWGQIQHRTKISEIGAGTKKINEVYCDLEETIKLVKELGGMVTIHAGKKSNSVECITNSLSHTVAQKKDIARIVDMFELGKESDAHDYNSIVFPEIKEVKPMIICSDNHDIKSYSLKQSCWIKGSPTFETLKQVVIDPENRVLIQERDPSESKSPSISIDRIEYELNSETVSLHLSKDLNSVIGKRGSGKSVLLKNIVKFIKPDELTERGIILNNVRSLSNFTVFWSDESENSDIGENHKSIYYIPQNYLSELTYEDGKKENERNDFLNDLLNNNLSFARAKQEIQSSIQEISNFISEKVSETVNQYDNILEKEKQYKGFTSQGVLEKEIESKKAELVKLNDGNIITSDNVNKHAQLVRTVALNKAKLLVVSQDIEYLNVITEGNIDIITPDFTRLSIETQNSLRGKIKENIDFNASKETVLASLTESKNTLDIQLSKDSKDLAPLQALINQNKTISDLTKEIEKLANNLQLSTALKTEIGNLKDALSNNMMLLKELYNSFKTRIEGIVNSLSLNQEFRYIKFEFEVFYNQSLEDNFFEDINRTKFSKETLSNISDGELDILISNILNGQYLRVNKARNIALMNLLSCRYEINFSKSIRLQAGNIPFENMTGGQKAMTLLELIFKLDNNNFPIIIDQPENDIDATGIANDIVQFLKIEKKDRQIIVATHNANLVLLSDTENIIVAENDNTNLKYHNGGIENIKIQEDVVNILEGGLDAMQKRMHKINIK